MDNRLTMDISRQLLHPLATMAMDADKCYNRINHIIMSTSFTREEVIHHNYN